LGSLTLTQCSYCNFTYDEWSGDTRNGVPAGTPIEDLAGTVCSRCGIQGIRHVRQYGPKYGELEAEYYDQFAGKAGLAFYKNWLEKSDEQPSILELGVGTGRLAVELAGSARRYCGVDWSPLMLKIADTKRRRLFKEAAEERLQLIEADILSFQTTEQYTHVLCPDGLLQHFALMEDHIALLRNIRSWLKDNGRIAIDLWLPPGESRWETSHRKRITPNKWVVRKIEGETSLTRQLYRCVICYEVYVEGTMESRYRVERDYALMTSKEMALLLALEGYEVTQIIENYGLSTPWRTALPVGIGEVSQELDASESIEEANAAGKNIAPYRQGVWINGGYPLDNVMPARAPGAPAIMTFIAQKSKL
jgi:SAM-dependent methyltransferase